MNNTRKMENIDDIMADFLSGEPLSSEDLSSLREWREHAEENEKYLDELKSMPLHSTTRRTIREEGNAPLLHIIEQIAKKRAKRRLIWSAAASIILLSGIFGTYQITKNHADPISSGNEWIANAPSVELFLPDGEKVLLTREMSTIIASDSAYQMEVQQGTLRMTSPLSTTEKIEYNTLRVPAGAEYNLILSDGSKVFLNSGSELKFPKHFQQENREVFLSGEAYFEVTPDSDRLFIVRTDEMMVKVLGTSFNVHAYPSQATIATTLEEGEVVVVCGDEEHRILPGNQVVYNKASHQGVVHRVNTELYTSWRHGYYLFEDAPFEQVMSTLALWYGFQVIYEDESVKTLEFTVRLKRYDDIHYILDKFRETGDFEISVENKWIRIKEKY